MLEAAFWGFVGGAALLIGAAAGLVLTTGQRVIGLIMAFGAYLPYSPLASALGFVALPVLYWPILLATLVCYVGLTQLIKMWLIRKSWV